ncbi:nitrogen assimilation response regulator NtrX [Gellertiella hungarica]|uniref:C4-dicarboxylate transport transcriptional regulatory protein DctD n=1 Tax=Gellertiella hungarica TaxID=1572859 RepID=A0A7W6J4L5_9HYPH|nr:sigma-54 dependent transcriptional regulator [Gellertiella hungarica]MBB4064709.1 two-component system nitrogen regulation response regulator NtrX [Gellertiella hungarica]
MASDILVVDDEEDIREIVSGILSDEGHETRTAHDSDSALAAISDRVPRLVFLDIWMQGSKLDGLALLDEIKARHPDLPVVMISGHGNIETAVSAIRRGAFDFIEKPFKADRLILVAERALETSKLRKEVTELKRRTGDHAELIGTSVAVSQLRQTIEKVSPTNSRIMILGPSGSGKELVARLIHRKSSRAAGPFVALNAAAITPERMEIALFGTEGGPGQPRKIGALEEAHRGILYLDEVGEMPRETQNKILRVLVDQQFERVGGSKRVKVDVRIISSTAYNLESKIAEGTFREDLFHRLAVVPVKVPPLAERREDIPFLVDQFMRQISEQAGIRARKIGDDAMAVLQAHDWPGNIRQLRNNIERLMILAQTDGPDTPITADMLPTDLGDMLPKVSGNNDYHIMTLPLREAREMFERDYLIAQINRFGGNISRTAEFVGMERSALHRKLKSLGV